MFSTVISFVSKELIFFKLFSRKKYNQRYGEIYSVDTLFQRYTGEKKTWTNGTCNSRGVITESGYFYSGGKFRHKYVKQNIKNLLEDKGYILSPPMLYSEKDIKKINISIN